MHASDAPTDLTQRTRISDGPGVAAPGEACVVVIQGEGLGRRADIGALPVLVGRSEGADLSIAHRSVSREHCRLWRDGGDCRVRDLGATNPLKVNDDRVDEAVLQDGDLITVGESILKFISHTSLEARYHEEIYQLATHDPLTDLASRRHFIESTEKEIARALRHGRALSLCILDVDLFKPVNDAFGHISGDEVLKTIAEVVRGFVRSEDTAARIGGEEFAVLLPESDAAAAAAFAERVRAAVATTGFRPGGVARRITISIGVAALDPARPTRGALMADADRALYRAKGEGRDRVCIAD